MKAVVTLGGAGLTAAATFTYAAPQIARLTGNATLATGARVVGARAAALIGCRILFMSAGVWITVAGFGIQLLIWSITDDALEEWCSLCAFGDKRTSRDAFRTAKGQTDGLAKALENMGVSSAMPTNN
jgi:hypothetical protein